MADKRFKTEKDPSLYHVPPQSIEAEESILSAVLIDNEALIDILEKLSPADFYRSTHQKIFTAVSELFSRNEPVDLVTLTNILRERGWLEEIGGATYLANLVDTVPLAVNAQHYAKIVHDKACLRRLIIKTNAIAKMCFEDHGDVDNIIDFAESSIFEISDNKIKPSFFRIAEIIEDNIDSLEERQGNKALVTGVATGFTKLDELTAGLQKSDLIILAGRPGMGKTALALNIANHAAVENNSAVAIFSLEMSKEQLSFRMLSSEARIDSSRLRRGFITQDDWIKITEHNVGLIIIDYIQLMKGRASAERRDLEVSEISRSLKALAKEISVPVLALSQLNRKLEERSDKRPQLADLRESGALEQDADVVAFIYRDELYNRDENNPNKGKAEIILAKQRNGPTGMATLTFLNSYTRFENYSARE